MHNWGRHHSGPVVGIITTGKSRSTQTNGIIHLYKDLISYGRTQGVFIYCFHPRNINWKLRKIKGYSYEGRKWSHGSYPFPDIVYNRILYRTVEESVEVKNTLKKFEQDDDVYLFNSRFLDKWEVHKTIYSNKETSHLVPDTELLSRETLIFMLKKHRQVLLKPRRSSKGQGIIKIKSFVNSVYLFSRAEWKSPRWVRAASIQSLMVQLQPLRIFNHNYLVQECIDLPRHNGRIFDLRCQYQKNGAGKWVLTGAGVRVAGKDRFVTHIPNGGSLAAYNDIIPLFNDLAVDETQSFDRQLKNIGIFIPRLLEEKLQLNLGVLSMDIGIDPGGRLLILEVNSKPARFDESHIRQRHLANLVDYFIFVAGKKYKRNDN